MQWSLTSAEELQRGQGEVLALLSAALEEALEITTRPDLTRRQDDLVGFIDLAGRLARSLQPLNPD